MTFSMMIDSPEALVAEAIAEARVQLAAVIDERVESQAKSLGYNSAAHIAGYKDSTIPSWSAEATAFIAWRDTVWVKVFELQAQYEAAGTVPTASEVLAELPAWSQ